MAFCIALDRLWTLTGSYLNFKDPQHKSMLKSFKLSELSHWEYLKFKLPPTGSKAPSNVWRGSLNTPVVSMSPPCFKNTVTAKLVFLLISIFLQPISNQLLWFIRYSSCYICELYLLLPSRNLHCSISYVMKKYQYDGRKVIRKKSLLPAWSWTWTAWRN